ncbi:MAG: GNAT family N-acetyltransferase [Planctomycetes bacterium]|nr:GNAT family N-acetyltransferase [Planctomycetota bacterium]
MGAPPGIAAFRGVLWAEVVRTAPGLSTHLAAWEALAKTALEPNPFYEPWMLVPAVEAFGRGLRLRFVFVYRMDSAHERQLIGFFPCEARRRYKGLPVDVLGLWKHVHCFLCTPLIHKDHGADALRGFYDWAGNDRRGGAFVDLSFVHAEGPFQKLLADLQTESRCVSFVDETWSRALIEPGRDANAYLASILSGSRRSELRRLLKRLGDLGRLETRNLTQDDDVEPWIERFLALEAAGWKGREGTALDADADQGSYFAAIARAAFTRKQLMMLGLFIDERPIALKCNFLAGRGSFAFKIAYDEAFAKYSPGVLLELDNIRELHRRPELRWMDSCAMAGHFMIGRLWKEQRALQSLALSTGRLSGALVLGALPMLRAMRRGLRKFARLPRGARARNVNEKGG